MSGLRQGVNEVQDAQLELSAIAALHVLYVDGTIAELRGICATFSVPMRAMGRQRWMWFTHT